MRKRTTTRPTARRVPSLRRLARRLPARHPAVRREVETRIAAELAIILDRRSA